MSTRSLAVVLLLVAGCSSSTDAATSDASTADGAVAHDSSGEAPSDVGDAVDATDGDDADAACHDVRRMNDGKQPADHCWAPPRHYCSGGLEPLSTVACAPDSSFCCTYTTSCIPCEFVECFCNTDGCHPAGCGDLPMVTDPDRCRRPSQTLDICWDGVDAVP